MNNLYIKLYQIGILLFCCFFFTTSIYSQGLNNAVAIGKFLNGNLPATTPSSTGGNPAAPLLLSQTGAFTNLNNLTVSPGVIPYDMIEPFWSDGAEKSRWMAIPNNGSHNTTAERISFSVDGNWDFPRGAVLIKHFELGGRRLETRFEVKGDDDVYYYLTYKWNAAQTDAQLLNGALDEVIQVNGINQVWHYPSRDECLSCHLTEVGSVLGPKTRHLNKSITYPSTGQTANQLVALSNVGIIGVNITNANVGNYMAIAAKDDLSASLEYRARSYIDVNCSNCHQPGTINGGQFDARITTPLDQQNIINGPLIYDEGLVNPRVVIPQDVGQSMMHYRMNSLQPGVAMPPLAKSVVDEEGVQLIEDWINSLSNSTSNAPEAVISASPVFGVAPLNTTFDATSSTDIDGDNLSYSWDFGDGTSASGALVTHIYTTPGTYLVNLIVSDGQLTDQATVSISVNTFSADAGIVNFTDQTSLLSGGNHYSGVAMAISDMNGDGKDDLIRYDDAKILNIHYQNNPNQSFSRYNYGSVSNVNQWSTCIGDYDQDGRNDILVGGAYDNIKLIRNNNGNNSYSSSQLPNSNIFIQGSNFADINNDGWADIFACHDDEESRAYRNNNGSFTYDANLISTETSPNSDNSGNYASMWTDFDNDGDLDLYISKCRIGVSSSSDPRRINMLWVNDGNNNFTEQAAQANLKIGAQSWLADFADIDNDGDLDCIVINHYDDCQLMRNNGNGTFTDITNQSGLLPTLSDGNVYGIQGLFRDFNNDGFVDLLVSGTRHYLFYNNGDNTFTQTFNPFTSSQIESFAVGDLNHDGFLDIYAGYANLFTTPSNRPDRLFMNDGNDNHFINIQLEGTVSNINAIGARVEIYGAWGKQIREVRSGEGYGIHNSFTQHFGLGQSTTIDKIVVRWPSGIVQEIQNPAIDQFITIIEDQCNLVGNTCNDNDPCTINDVYDSNCNCSGTFQDTDGDGICDANDNNSGNCTIGASCNDGDECTINDVYDSNCNCAGTFADSDNDGICNVNDPTNGNCQLGGACNDGDPCTINDAYNSSCDCVGVFQDSDGDGICDANDDTDGNCTSGVSCNDNDPCTINDAYNSSCDCVGVFQDSDGDGICDANDDTDGNCTSGVSCNDNDPCTINDVYDSNCNCTGTFQDSDGDGICDANDDTTGDCTSGASCNDNDPCTINDVYDSNCNCTGTFQDSDGDGICDANDSTDGNCTAGASCNDNDPCTINDVYDSNCNCSGTFQDSDGDGICDANDDTAGDCTSGASCNDNDPCTINDVYDSNCNCTGTFQDSDGDGICDANDPCPNDATDSCNGIQYCASAGINTNYEFIESVIIGSINNISGNDGGYGDYTNLSSTHVLGETVSIELTPGFSGSAYNEYFKVFIDFNQDGDFDDNGETVFEEATYTSISSLISIPTTATLGSTRMRVSMRWNTAPTSCGTHPYGEVEDYTIELIEGSGCSVGASCDDGDECTINDVYDSDCNCSGTFQDTDGDGICDANDDTAGDCSAGASCNDGDECTINDVYDSDCNCAGTFQDSDSDDICDAIDPCPNDPNNACITQDYCAASATNTNYEFIEKVVIGSISNTSGDDGGYGDYTNLSTTHDLGETVAIELVPGFSESAYNEYFTIWIDFNKDGDFNDNGEKVFEDNTYTSITSSFDLPNNAILGSTRMRVAMKWNSAASACGSYTYGEVEDYTIVLGEGNGGGNDCSIGSACDDGDDCTINDVLDNNCNCTGTFQDSDNDSNCDVEDPCPNDPNDACINVEYCSMFAYNSNFEFIQSVEFGSINNNSGDDGGYADYTNISTMITPGETYPITLTPGFSNATYNEVFRIWIDFNKDGDFDDANEEVLTEATNAAITSSISIPMNINNGSTRMRVAMRWNNAPTNPCAGFSYGEVEDYTLIIGGQNSFVTREIEALNYELFLYPNPVKNQLNIQLNQSMESGQLFIFDNLGRLIDQLDVEDRNTFYTLDVSQYAEGIYFTQLITEKEKKIVKKFIKIE